MKNNKLLIASLITNLLIFLLLLIGVILMFTLGGDALAERGIGVLKYFTLQSNIFMGVIAPIYAYHQYLLIKGIREEIPHVLRVFNHVGVTAVGLTFLIVIFFLAPGYGFPLMYQNANLFFHALLPLAAMINFMFLEKECAIKFKETPFAVIPSLIYGIIYFIIVVSLNGYGDINIDFYMFGANGPFIGALNFLAVMSIAYVFGLLVFFINRLRFKNKN